MNKKIESVDNYHLLFEEITLGRFGRCCTDIYRILALFDKRMISDSRKMRNIADALRKNGIFSNGFVNVEKYLFGVCDTQSDYVGTIYMEAVTHTDSLIAKMTVATLENWNFVPAASRQLMKKQNVVNEVLTTYDVDGGTDFSLELEYEQSVVNKHMPLNVLTYMNNEKATEDFSDVYGNSYETESDDEYIWETVEEPNEANKDFVSLCKSLPQFFNSKANEITIFWETVESKCGYCLQKHIFSSHKRILNPRRICIAWGWGGTDGELEILHQAWEALFVKKNIKRKKFK